MISHRNDAICCLSFPSGHQPFFPKGHLEKARVVQALDLCPADAQGFEVLFPFPGSPVRCELILIRQFNIFSHTI